MGIPLPNINAPLDNYVLTADILATGTNTDYGGGLGIVKRENVGTGIGFVQPNSTTGKHTYLQNLNNRNGNVLSQTTTNNYIVGDYHTHRLTKQGTTILYEILHNNDIILSLEKTNLNSNITSVSVPCLCIGRWSSVKIKNIKLEPL